MSKDLYTLIRASGNSGASGQSFRNHVTGAASGVKMSDYRVTGLTYVSGAPNAPAVTTYGTPHTFTLVFTLVRGPKAYLIQTLLDAPGTYLSPQDASLSSGTRTLAQVVSWDHQTNTNNTITITITVTVTGTVNAGYIPGTGGGQYSVYPPGGTGRPDSVAIVGGVLSTSPIIYKFRAGFNDAGAVVPLSTKYYDNSGEITGSGGVAYFDGDAVGGNTSGYTDSPVGLQWLLTNIDSGVFNLALYTAAYPFRQSNESSLNDPAFKWYSNSSFTTLVHTGAEFSPGASSTATTYGPIYVKHTSGLYYGYPSTPIGMSWSDPRPDV